MQGQSPGGRGRLARRLEAGLDSGVLGVGPRCAVRWGGLGWSMELEMRLGGSVGIWRTNGGRVCVKCCRIQ